MAIITPQTDVYLIKCPLEINDANQLTFANATAQANYFLSLPKINVGDDFTYQRKDGVMRVPALVDDLYGYNYVMYKNEGHSNKWFFAYITGLEYLNDSVTAISLKTDVYQTWMFDLDYKRTFVEREHVNDDTVGLHTVPEDLDTGEYVNADAKISLLPNKMSWVQGADRTDPSQAIPNDRLICFQVTEIQPLLPNVSGENWYGYMNGVFSGLFVFGVITPATARRVIAAYDAAGRGDSIVSIFVAPTPFFDDGLQLYNIPTLDQNDKIIIPRLSYATSILKDYEYFTMPSTIDGYSPKNNKLKCWPYNFMRVDNNNGGSTTFRYEDFKMLNGERRPYFGIEGAFGQGCAIALVPRNYKNDEGKNFDYGVPGAKYPQCAWKSDYYTNWLTQNAVSYPFGIANSTASAGLGIAAGLAMASPIGVIGGAISLISSITGAVGKKYEAQIHPDQAKGQIGNGDLLIGADIYFTLRKMSIRSEYARIIDNYFSMFGYKVNEVKVPNITGRRNWNFVKTIGCYIEADIPQDDLQEIKSMFDKGITFWHNPSTFMDYSQNNDII